MNFSDQFPVLEAYTYLNTANSGILSRNVVEWRAAHDEDFLLKGSVFRLSKDDFLQNGREALANLFHADASRTYLLPNFSHGFNAVLAGLGAPKRFLLVKDDYPSVNYPVISSGNPHSFVEADEQLEQNILEAINVFQPEVLALSLVQYSTGLKIDFDFLKQLKADHPDLLIIADGTQFCGTTQFNFNLSGIDVLIASGYKWMLGGYGNGFAFMSEMAAKTLYQDAKSFALPVEGFLKGRDTLSLYLEPGHIDTLCLGTLFQSINYLGELGLKTIENKVSELNAKARQAFLDRNLLAAAIANRENYSSIFNLMLPSEFLGHLGEHNIIATSRGTGIRVSFHFYNSENDLEKLLQVIDQYN